MTDYTVPAVVDGHHFNRVLGVTERVGWGPTLYTYTVYIEPGIEVGPRGFAAKIDTILADKRGWIRGGKVSFQRVSSGANTQVLLAHPETVDALCAPLQTEGEVSCCQGTKIVLNVKRWRHGVPHWTGRLKTYRQMLCNHEWGHRLGKPHRLCPGPGQTAPCMMQQTYGFAPCHENSWPLDYEL